MAIVDSPRFCVLHRRLALALLSIVGSLKFCALRCWLALDLRGHRWQPKVLRPSPSARPGSTWTPSAAQGSASFAVGSPWLCMAIVDSSRFCVLHCRPALALRGHRRRPEVLHPSSVNRGSAWPSSAHMLSSPSPCWSDACGPLTQVAYPEASSGQTGPDAGSVHFLSLAEMSGSEVLLPVTSQAANHNPTRFAWHALGCWMGLCQACFFTFPKSLKACQALRSCRCTPHLSPTWL